MERKGGKRGVGTREEGGVSEWRREGKMGEEAEKEGEGRLPGPGPRNGWTGVKRGDGGMGVAALHVPNHAQCPGLLICSGPGLGGQTRGKWADCRLAGPARPGPEARA